MKILVIEDDINVRESICDLLETKSYQAASADNGLDGIKLAREIKPDLILCDVMMPGLSGHDVLKDLRSTNDLAITPFVFLSAKSQKDDVRAGMNLGADDYLTKPFLAKELFDVIESRLERREAIRNKKIEQLEPLRKKIVCQGLLTPIQSLVNTSELVLKYFDDYDKEEIINYIKSVKNSSIKLERAAKNIILFESLKLAKHDPDVKAGFLNGCTENVHDLIKESVIKVANLYNRELDLFFKQVDDAKLQIPDEIFKVIITEISYNAFQYSKSFLVTLETQLEDEYYTLEMSNTGLISKEKLKELGISTQKTTHGLGMGIYLTSALVTLAGGQFQIQAADNQVKVTLRLKMV